MDAVLSAIAGEAVRELKTYGTKTPGERARDLARRLCGRRVPAPDPVFWPAGLLGLGLTEYDGDREGAVRARLDAWLRGGGRTACADDAVMLYSAVRIDTAEHNVPYREAADRMARSLMDAPKDAAGTLIYRPGRAHDYVFADGIGMAALFLDAYGRAYGDERASGEAAKQLKAYLSMATDARTGLPYHGYETAAGTKNGLVGWGRAVGWLMMGMSGTQDAGLRLRLRDLARSAEELCGEDGLFPWLLTAPQGPRDVSATAMIRWAEARALENGALPASDREKFSAGFSASAEGILAHTADGRVGQSLSECAGFAEHPQIYGCYPWGQGAALAFLSLWRRP